MVKVRETYVTTDGREFATSSEAEAHESQIELKPLAEAYIARCIKNQRNVSRKRMADIMTGFAVAMLNPEQRASLSEEAGLAETGAANDASED